MPGVERPGGISPSCWCGNATLAPYSERYLLCRACGTLVAKAVESRDLAHVRSEETDLYGLNYFFDHARELGHPDLPERSRLDLSERCVFWLKSLLRHRLPPARTLELGCASGSFVAMLASAGYDAAGLDLSPAVTDYARRTFDVPVLTGPLEEQRTPPGSLDVVIMMDVLEHMPDPVATLTAAAQALAPHGLLLVQTPCFDPSLSHDELQRSRSAFLEQMKPEEHLYLLGRESAAAMMARAGFDHLEFEPAIFADYDMFFVASRAPVPTVAEEEWRKALRRSRASRIVEALVDAFDASRSYRPAMTDHAALEAELAHVADDLPTCGEPSDPSDVAGRGVIARTVRAIRRAVDPLDALSLLRQVGRIDYEQLVAFQYAKLLSPGDQVIDVGARTGLHAARFLHLVGDAGGLVIVEPQPDIVARFLRPLYGDRPNCRIFQGALSDRTAESSSGRPPGAEIDPSTLDALAGDLRTAFIRIAVGGAELEVLSGGKTTLAASRPVVALETHADSLRASGGGPGRLHDLAMEQGYAIATLFGSLLSRSGFEAWVASGVIWNFFLLPAERAEQLAEVLRRADSPYATDRFIDLRASDQAMHVQGLVGFSGLESWGRWTDGRILPRAYVHLTRPLPAAFVVEIVAMGAGAPGSKFDVIVGDAVRTLTAPVGRLATLTADFVTGGMDEVIALRPRSTICPADATPGGDPRRLGVGIQSIRVLGRQR